MILNLILLSLLCTSKLIFSQEEPKIALTAENVETLKTILTEECRDELDYVIMGKSEMSDSCKYELQGALQSSGIMPENAVLGGFSSEPDSQADAQKSTRKQKRTRAPKANPESAAEDSSDSSAPVAASDPWISPLVGIIGFLIISVAGLAYLVISVNSQIQKREAYAVKPKKLSKKKDEKLRNRTSQQQLQFVR